MKTILLSLALVWVAGCQDDRPSNFYDLGVRPFKSLGDRCTPDVAPNSECGYPPQFYCSAAGVCASACNVDADCAAGAKCVGAGDMTAGECQLPTGGDGGL